MKKKKRKAAKLAPAPAPAPAGVPIKFVTYPRFEEWTTLEPGSARWAYDKDDRIAGLNFSCPGGCRDVGTCRVVPPGVVKTEDMRPAWEWDGNETAPTLKPSILSKRPHGCGWHGYLTAGVFQVIAGPENQCHGDK